MPFWNGSSWTTTQTNIFNTGLGIGIGEINPLATLDVLWSVRMLSSMTGRRYVLADNRIWYFPQGIATWLLNTWLQGDSIRYVTCEWKWEILLFWLTWSNISLADSWFSNAYFLLPMDGWLRRETLVYHLKAGETFGLVTICPVMFVYKQEYGKQISPMGGGMITWTDYESVVSIFAPYVP